ncbi:hypothetical protein Afil01_17180 [Actinorhabdospora filicis]|uniref:Uncharacterized protein n=1 Tax=Actinorhabdospora filicis TaxID=1785913 RepID=A0A9W6W8W8_9ACTN|nr:hypothetical protein [Actinorhabdospora filicis]GLZ76911.1 hypothetical protein Afil01_17180 [Actinorhabdospora filicis]
MSDETPVDIELSEEDTALDDVDDDGPRPSLRERLRKPWPRPVIAVIAALAAALGTAAVVRPDPPRQQPPAPNVAEPEPGPIVSYWIPLEKDHVLTDKGWIALDPENGEIVADLETDANNKVGAAKSPVWAGSGVIHPVSSGKLAAGKYDLHVACAGNADYISMRFQVRDPDGDFFFETDLPCDGPAKVYHLELATSASLQLEPVGPNALLVGYAFWAARTD